MNKLQSDKTQGSSIRVKFLTEYKDALKLFLDLISSLRGPQGRGSMLQNMCGGNLTLTSSSRSLFSGLSVKKAIVKLIVSACQSHLSLFKDGGLFLTGLTTRLVVEALEMDVNLVLLSDVIEVMLTVLLEFLNSSSCSLKVPACMSDLSFIKSFVNSIIKSKPLCQLNKESLRHVSQLIIECFLAGISDRSVANLNNVFIHCQEQCDVLQSFLKDGVLIEAPELSRFAEKNLNLKFCNHGDRQLVKVAMVTVSMSGDMEELSGVGYSVQNTVDFNDAVLDRLTQFCEVLIGQQVGLVLCQKVVHPELKYKLREKGVLVVDRLGNQPISYIQSLTGACPIQCLDVSTSLENTFGWLDGVSHTIVQGKSYLHLKKHGSEVATLYLCHQHEEHLKELKDVCSTALISLGHLLYEPSVLPGAGCWQAFLASYLHTQVKENMDTLCKDVGCTESVLKATCGMFMKCLVKAGTDRHQKHSLSSINGHLYYTGHMDDDSLENCCCCCGLEDEITTDKLVQLECYKDGEYFEYFNRMDVDPREVTKDYLSEKLKSREIIMDSFVMCKNALQTAVLTAVSALRIGQVIEDAS